MPALITIAGLCLFAYLVGSIPFSFLVAKSRGVDLRKVGSGNTGASNVWRNCGFPAFLVALALDMTKGFVPTWVAYRLVQVAPVPVLIVGVVAMLGHMLPIFLRFRGGKAVATAAGVLLALNPWLVLLAAVLWSAVYKLKGYPSLASMVSTFLTALAGTWMALTQNFPVAFAAFIWVALVVVVYMHRANIQRLLRGQELGIGPRTK